MPVEGPLTSQTSPPSNFNFLLGFQPLYFAKTIKSCFLIKLCGKNVKIPALWAPDMRWGGGGARAPCALLAASLPTTNAQSGAKVNS